VLEFFGFPPMPERTRTRMRGAPAADKGEKE